MKNCPMIGEYYRRRTIKVEEQKCFLKEIEILQQIDLMELTHHSNDHINGILGYVGEHKDDNPFPVRKLWVNCARQIDIAQGGNLSASQASDLADALAEIQKTSPIIWKDKIVEGMDTSDIKFADVDDIAIFLYSFLYSYITSFHITIRKSSSW